MRKLGEEVVVRVAAVLAGLGALAMAGVLVYGFAGGSFASEGRQLLGMIWGRVSLVDLYVGFLLFSAWIVFRDGHRLRSLLWVAAVLILGSLGICLYVLDGLRRTKGDWRLFFLGRRARPSC